MLCKVCIHLLLASRNASTCDINAYRCYDGILMLLGSTRNATQEQTSNPTLYKIPISFSENKLAVDNVFKTSQISLTCVHQIHSVCSAVLLSQD